MSLQKIDKWTATAIVVANMIGTGVFTSLGFQLSDIQNAWSILFLWVLGGLIALAGAFTYAEVGSYWLKNGGEYYYLSRLYHPSLGFVAGFVSVIVGFAAPIAAAAVAFSKYFSYSFFHPSSFVQTILALAVVSCVSVIHLLSIRVSSMFQKYITLIKILIITLFASAFFFSNANPSLFEWKVNQFISDVFSPAFAVSLIYVSYAYSGWNAAAYVAGEIAQPERNLSKALLSGTSIVMVLYVLLNISFLYAAPVQQLKGNVEVGIISAQYIFGKTLGAFIGLLISLLLVSAISSMLIASPRVLASMGEDYRLLAVFEKRNKFQSPYMALMTVWAISALLILTSSFQWLINFIGITLIIFTTFTAMGIFLLRKKENYKPVFISPLFPFMPLFFIVANLWILLYVSIQEYTALMVSFLTIIIGFTLYYLTHRLSAK